MALKNARRRLRHPFRKIAAAEQAFLIDVTTDGQPIPAKEMVAAVRSVVGENAFVYAVDSEYLMWERRILDAYLERDGTDRYPYKAEGGDCDDFSFVLKGRTSEAVMRASGSKPMCIGLVVGRFKLGDAEKLTDMHMMCCALLNGGELVLVEPQNDRVYPFTADSKVVVVLI